MERTGRRKSKGVYTVLWLSIVSLAIAVIGGVYYYKQADDSKKELHNAYMRSFHDMTDYINDIDISLKKTMLTKDARLLSNLSTQLYMQAEAAKTNLSELPIEDASFDKTQKFLSQVGDYSSYLSRKTIESEEISDEEYDNLGKLSSYASALKDELQKMETAIYDNTMKVESLKASSQFVAFAEGESFADGMQKVESMRQEYPSLIYDGPFSDHIETSKPKLIENEKEISRYSAEDVVKSFLGREKASMVAYDGDGDGLIKTYMFSGNTEKGTITLEITKKGGKVLWMLNSREVDKARLSLKQAMNAGESFLTQKGYPSMKSSYYEVADNIATINYAYFENDTVMYPDLIKLKVAMDNGEIVGFESQGFIMCHKNREIPQDIISEEEARQKVGTHLVIDTISKAYIPLESKREVFCYELKGTLDDKNFLIYINAKTGKEEKILMLLETKTGVLTI